MFNSIIAIAVGGAVGCLLRWSLSVTLNSLFPSIPPGTLAANLIGGYLIGVAIVFFSNHPELAPEWRLLVITGFLGGLTTFSTFSAEVVTLLQQGRHLWACGAISVHVGGALMMTMLGIGTVAMLKHL
jgi:CrcB protein